MDKSELVVVVGGATSLISGTVLNAIVRAVNAALDVGRALGTAVRRISARKVCTLK